MNPGEAQVGSRESSYSGTTVSVSQLATQTGDCIWRFGL